MNGRLWQQDEIELVREYFPCVATRDLAELLGRSISCVYNLACKLGVRKEAWLVSTMSAWAMRNESHGGRTCQFKKGIVPANKGMKMPKGWAPGRMRETQFRSGQQSWRTMPVGATRYIDGYLYRKVSEVQHVPYTVNWKAEHVLRWEKRRGPVPAGHALVFRDGNRSNFKLKNLELLTRAELMSRNTIHRLPEPLKELIRLNGSIRRTITMRKKHGKEQDERPA